MLSLNDLPTDISNVAMEKPSSNDHLNESALPDVVVVNSDPCSGPSKSCSQELSLISFHSKSINRTETNDNAQRASFLHTLEDGRGHVSHFVSCSSGDADPCAERDFLQLSGSRGSKREPFHGCEEIEVRGCKKKPKSEHLGLSLALPDVSLALTSENAARNPPERTHSVKSRTPSSNTRTSSDDFTASRSYSYSHLISHSPSCSLTGYPMEYDCSTGSHRTDNDQSWYLHEETNGSVHSRFKPAGDSMVFSAQTHTNCNSTVFRATGSENISFFPSELPARPTNFTKSNDSRNEGPLPSEVRPDKILRVIATESVPTVAQIFQHELLPETVEAVKDHLKNILEGKRDEFECIRQLVQKRKDLSFDTLSKCHQAQLDILVTIKSGSSSFLSKKIHLPSSELIEIFMQLRCRNVVCKNLLPVDDCDCTICSSKKGFCSSCMCAVCVNFDCAANTCSWVGCDVCLHWCHAMCGIQNNLIKPGPSAKGDTGNMEMQFNCLGCGHASELFGFVKEVFLCCASNWGPETLLKELDCVQNIFQGSMDLKGKQLYSHASETKHTLEKKIVSCTEASNRMLQFFNYASDDYLNFGKNVEVAQQANFIHKADATFPGAATLIEANTLRSSKEIDKAAQPINRCLSSEFRSQTDNDSDSLETMIRIKEAEARMFQRKADDARREAEGYRMLVGVKSEKLDEEYGKKLAALRLQDAEERRRMKLEELKMLESSHCDYYKMKLRMEAEIAGLLKRVETAKRQLCR